MLGLCPSLIVFLTNGQKCQAQRTAPNCDLCNIPLQLIDVQAAAERNPHHSEVGVLAERVPQCQSCQPNCHILGMVAFKCQIKDSAPANDMVLPPSLHNCVTLNTSRALRSNYKGSFCPIRIPKMLCTATGFAQYFFQGGVFICLLLYPAKPKCGEFYFFYKYQLLTLHLENETAA